MYSLHNHSSHMTKCYNPEASNSFITITKPRIHLIQLSWKDDDDGKDFFDFKFLWVVAFGPAAQKEEDTNFETKSDK